MLSNTSKYAIRAVIYIAVSLDESQGKIGIKKIADSLDIPSPFLSKILQVLVRKKLLTSTKGPNGGFGIGKDPAKLTLYDIIYEMEGSELFDSCLLGSGNCDSHADGEGYCTLHKEFHAARQALIDLYKTKTIQELAAQANQDVDRVVL